MVIWDAENRPEFSTLWVCAILDVTYLDLLPRLELSCYRKGRCQLPMICHGLVVALNRTYHAPLSISSATSKHKQSQMNLKIYYARSPVSRM